MAVARIKSCARRLEEELEVIQQKMMELLDASKINHNRQLHDRPDSRGFDNDPLDEWGEADGGGRLLQGGLDIGPSYEWGEADERTRHLQMEFLELYRPWFEHFSLLFKEAPGDLLGEINDTHSFVTHWAQGLNQWDVPASIEEAKVLFSKNIHRFVVLLQMLKSPDRQNIIVVPDTNALAICPDFQAYRKVAGQAEFTLLLTPTVLSELDALKADPGKTQGFRDKVKSVITRIKGLRKQGDLHQGVVVNKTVTVRMEAREPDFEHTLSWLRTENKDDRIVAYILELQRQEPSAMVILSTADINLQNKAEMAHIAFVEPPGAD